MLGKVSHFDILATSFCLYKPLEGFVFQNIHLGNPLVALFLLLLLPICRYCNFLFLRNCWSFRCNCLNLFFQTVDYIVAFVGLFRICTLYFLFLI